MTDILEHPSLYKQIDSNGCTYFQFPTLMFSIEIHVTAHKESFEEYIAHPETLWTQCAPPSVPVSIQHGKPCFRSLLKNRKTRQVGAMAVSVCGPGGLGDSVRAAVRDVQGEKTVDLFEEAFQW